MADPEGFIVCYNQDPHVCHGLYIAVMTLHLLQIFRSEVTQDHLDYTASLHDHPGVELYGPGDLAAFLRQDATHSIAVVDLDHFDWPANRTLLARLRPCRRVIVRSHEYGQEYEAIMRDHDLANFEWITCSAPPLRHARHTPSQDWLLSTAHPYFHEPAFVATRWQERLSPDRERDHTFEVMLGRPKPHRDLCRRWVTANVPARHYLMSDPLVGDTTFDQLPEDSVFREPEMKTDPDNYTVDYLGRRTWQSMVLPIRLYEKTQHSVVCETLTDVCFPTEKTCKPIMAQRLFVVLSCQGYLAHLRGLGFRTFHGIIDESYDSVPDDAARWTQALEQMRSLVDRPWPELWPQLRPVVEHNLQHLRALPTQVLLDRVRHALDPRHVES